MTLPRLAEDVRLVGTYPGSGFREPRYLLVRGDERMLHVSRLLFVVAANLDGRHPAEEVADRVSTQYRRRLTTEGLHFLVEAKLRPLGLIDDGNRQVPPPRPSPAPPARVLGLRLRLVLLPPRLVEPLCGALTVLFLPVVVAAALAGLVATDAWLLRTADLGRATAVVLAEPATILLLLGILAASVLFHELGHAAGCRYGGGRPGAIGMGLYLIYPALYTDVTDAQRLGRAGRLRTDLGGIYFNALAVLAVAAGYALTGYEPLVLAVVLIHLELLQQLLPVVRLDGYYILTDLAGVPDLFDRVRPVLASLLPWREADSRVRELRPAARATVTAWVLVVVPVLAAVAGLAVVHAPDLLRDVWRSELREWHGLRAAADAGDAALVALGTLSMVLLALPVIGAALLVTDVARRLLRAAVRRTRRRPGVPAPLAITPPRRAIPQEVRMDSDGAGATRTPPASPRPGPRARRARQAAHARGRGGAGGRPPAGGPGPREPLSRLTAADFTEDTMLRGPARAPTRGWRRGVYVATRGALNPGPGPAERREQDLLRRLRTPIEGSRRIVVLSRKGGAGKTTTTLMLGHTFASVRGDRVVALDGNPDAGSLAHRIRRQSPETVTTLLAKRATVQRYADMRAFTSQAPDTRLEVVASDDDPRITQALGEVHYRHAIDVLDRHYNLIVIDTGTGILDGAVQGVLGEADQIVVVMPPALDGGRVASMTLDWLDQHGYTGLVRGAVAVINAVRGGGPIELDRMEAHFAARCAGVVRIPWDRALSAGGRTAYAELGHATRVAFLDLAATIAEGFDVRSPRRTTA
ncbi:MAG TPA: MinD/ParA family protein [Acidimicrobiales bacterium]